MARSVTCRAASAAATAAMRRRSSPSSTLGILAEAAPGDVALAQREQRGQRLAAAHVAHEAAHGAVGPVGRVEEHVVGDHRRPRARGRRSDSFSRRQIASAISAPTYSCLKKLYSPGAPSRGWRARGLPTSCSSAPRRTMASPSRRVDDGQRVPVDVVLVEPVLRAAHPLEQLGQHLAEQAGLAHQLEARATAAAPPAA